MAAETFYATEEELEGITGRTFGGGTVVNTTQIDAMLDQISAKLDGLLGRDEGDLGDSDTVPEWAKQAVLAAAAMTIDNIYEQGTPSTEEQILAVLRSHMEKNNAYPNKRIFYDQQRPNSSGNW